MLVHKGHAWLLQTKKSAIEQGREIAIDCLCSSCLGNHDI